MSSLVQLSEDALYDVALSHEVCVRPIVHEVRDTETGAVHLIPTPCGSRHAAKCPPCAEKNRRLRMQQCREGWHLEEEPERPERQPVGSRDSMRRKRSTRRRQDAPDLPNLPIEDRTVGKAFAGTSGRVYRPSMFVTFTLPSYGRVRPDGTPVDPSTYDYRRAALDALHFPKLVDRMWQNLRRSVGYRVQYFAVIEPQRRLAPHLHAAVRGAVPRSVVRDVVEATYHQVWWPDFREPVHVDRMPVWSEVVGYVDPDSGVPLLSWDEALDELEADASSRPSHVLRFGRQLNVQGILSTESDADRRVGYLTKYLAKGFAEAFADAQDRSERQLNHVRRLHEEVRWLPCSPRCWNWLRFGVQPLGSHEGMTPGSCPSKAHDEAHLGCGGRRVLVSRLWTGKTLQDHKADRMEVVRQVLLTAGIEQPEIDRLATWVRRADGSQRFHWQIHDPLTSSFPLYRQVMTKAIRERVRWKTEYEAAKERAGPLPSTKATGPPRPPDSPQFQVSALPVRGERSESRSDTQCP